MHDQHHSTRRRRALAMGIAALGVAVLPFLVPGVLAPKVAHAAPSIATTFPFDQAITTRYNPTMIVSGPGGDLWFAEGTPYVERLTPSGTFTTFAASADPFDQTGDDIEHGIAVGPDGNLWVTQRFSWVNSSTRVGGVVARVTPSGTVSYFSVPSATQGYTPGPLPYEIVSGPNSDLWFTEKDGNRIASATTSGVMHEFTVPTASSSPTGIVVGPDGNLWFTESASDKIGRMTPSGTFTEYAVTVGSQPLDIVVGPDNNLWFSELGTNKIGTITTAGTGYAEFATPTANSEPVGITKGPDGALWFAENRVSQIGRITTNGVISEYSVAGNPFGVTSGPDGNIWYTDYGLYHSTLGQMIGRLPLSPCGDLTTSVTSQNNGTGLRDTPGSQEHVQTTLSNCGVPELTTAMTSTTVTPPSGCPAAPKIPTFASTLAYGQSATSTPTFAAPSCLGTYTVTSTTKVGSSTVATYTTYYVVSNGTGSHIVGDFNGDGYQDVAISGQVGVGSDTGQVLVYYGGPNGLDSRDPQVITPTTPGMPSQLASVGQVGLSFGFSLVAGDYNGDGYSDLAIGVPGYGYTSTGYVPGKDGAVVVLRGGPAGVTTSGSQFIPAPSGLCQQCNVDPNNPETGSDFGWSLASGDFNHDGLADLAIDAPFATIGSAGRAGAVTLMYGSSTGLGATQTVLTESTTGMPGPAAASLDGFGWSMAVGDFKHNGFADLAIAAPGKAGDTVLYGSSSGLTTTGSQYLQGVGPYAYQLASGDFNGNGFSDLAVGESCGNMVEIHYGSTSGLGSVAFKTAQEITPSSPGMPREPGKAYFGEALAAGDIKHNGRDDLVISGAPDGNIIVWGTSTKLTTKGAKLVGDWPQILGFADPNGDGYADLLDGNPYQDRINPQPKINVYNGTSTGLASTPTYGLTQQTPSALSLTGHTAGQDGFCGPP